MKTSFITERPKTITHFTTFSLIAAMSLGSFFATHTFAKEGGDRRAHANRFKQMANTDGDGKISDQEKKAFKTKMQQRKANKSPK